MYVAIAFLFAVFLYLLNLVSGLLGVGPYLNSLRFVGPSLTPLDLGIADPVPVSVVVEDQSDITLYNVALRCRVAWMRIDEDGFRAEFSEPTEDNYATEKGDVFILGGDENQAHIERLLRTPEEQRRRGELRPHEPVELDCGLKIYKINELLLEVAATYELHLVPGRPSERSRTLYFALIRDGDGRARWKPGRPFGGAPGEIPQPYPSMALPPP